MTTRKEKKKRAARNINRRQRRKEYKALMVTFLLEGGHKDYIPPFSHNWKQILNINIRALEEGKTFLTQPKGWYDPNLYTSSIASWSRFNAITTPSVSLRP